MPPAAHYQQQAGTGQADPMFEKTDTNDQRRILLVTISLMIAVAVVVLAMTIWMLYRAGFNQRVEVLQAMVAEQVALIEAVARFNEKYVGEDFEGGADAATLSQIVDGFANAGGFGSSGEFVLGQRVADKIEFQSEFRFVEAGARKVVPFNTDRAAPMRRALSGERGWMIGPDYRGETVLAAFEPIPHLDLGLVAKLDIEEVNAPFRRAAMIALGIAILIVLVGGALILRIVRPIVSRIERIQERFRSLIESAPDPLIIVNESRQIQMVNRPAEVLFGYDREEIVGFPIERLMPERFRAGHPEKARSFFENPTARSLDTRLDLLGLTKEGREFPIEVSLSPIETEDGMLVASSVRDIAERREVEDRLRTLSKVFMEATDPIIIEDPDGRVVEMNHEAERAYGWSRAEMLGESIQRMVPSERHEQAAGLLARCKRGEDVRNIEGLRRDKHGKIIPVLVTLSLLKDEDGRLIGIASLAKDITEQKAAERNLRQLNADAERQRKIETALNRLSEVLRGQQEMQGLADVIVHQVAGHLELQFAALFVHRGETSYVRESEFGYPGTGGVDRFETGSGLLGQVVADRTPVVVDEVPEYARLALGSGTVALDSLMLYPLVHEEEVLGVLELGGLKPLDKVQRAWLEKAAEGLAVTIRLVLDLEQRNRAEKELAEAKETAESANKSKSAFLANMSHELRTPMNAILGYSEMLMEEAEDLEQDEFVSDLKKIHQAGTHLLALINDVLDLSKIESGRMEAFPETFDVGSLIDQVSDTATPLVGKNENRLSIDRTGELGEAHTDLTKLRQSLFNLLSNAAKFTHGGTITLHAERLQRAGGDWLEFAIRDTGIGIPDDKLEHVFEEFSQADASTTRDYGGTGLGLPISRKFCRMMGGDLTLTSVVGEGSTFTVLIPAALPGTVQEAPEASVAPVTTDKELAALRATGGGRTVLVIDDDPQARDLIARFLRRDGFEVATAAGGEEGLRLAHELKPAAITLDVMMPDMDGWSVLRALKADPTLQSVPVVMLSMVDDKGKGYALGATDYLTKPVDRDVLHERLARYLDADGSSSVLLVEDDENTRQVMARTLSKAGCQTREAANGQEALDSLAAGKPDLILLDLMMPVMDGFDFLLEMRANSTWRKIPVIVLTAKDLTDDDRRVLSGRVEQIVEKGAQDIDQVVDLIHQSLGETGGKAATG